MFSEEDVTRLALEHLQHDSDGYSFRPLGAPTPELRDWTVAFEMLMITPEGHKVMGPPIILVVDGESGTVRTLRVAIDDGWRGDEVETQRTLEAMEAQAAAARAQALHVEAENTSLSQLRGARCAAMHGVMSAAGTLDIAYIHLGGAGHRDLYGAWHRFYLHAGSLFWSEGPEPDEWEDLQFGDRYIDLGASLRLRGAHVRDIVMKERHLTLSFDNGARIVLRHDIATDGTSVVESVPGEPVT